MSLKNIDNYIYQFPENIQIILQNIRKIIQETNKNLTESINYGIPTFKLKNKNFFHFGAFKSHISIFPGPKIIEIFSEDLKDFKVSKGTIQFSLSNQIPYDLIKKIAEYKNNEEFK